MFVMREKLYAHPVVLKLLRRPRSANTFIEGRILTSPAVYIRIFCFGRCMVIFIFQKSGKKNRHRHSVGSTSARRSDVDVVTDGDGPEEEPEVPKDRKEKDIETDDELPYTIETSDVMGRSVTSWEGLWCHEGYCDISGSLVASCEIQ